MKRELAWILCTALAFTVGCGSDSDDNGGSGSTGQPDAGEDVTQEAAPDTGSPDAPADVALDEGIDVTSEAGQDAAPDATDDAPPDVVEDVVPDVMPDVADDVVPDVVEDVVPDVVEDVAQVDASTRPPGQCGQDSDCSGPAAYCTMSAPGGICGGCGTASDCGNPFEFECNISCRRLCVDDEDCPLGKQCSSTGYCNLISCSASCPDPYVCSGGFCRRPQCASATPQCPTGMSCGQGDYCVEDGL
jgi:hypothetical protein